MFSDVHLSHVKLGLNMQDRVGDQWERRLSGTSEQVRPGRWRWRKRGLILELIESGVYSTWRQWPLATWLESLGRFHAVRR